MAPVGLWQGRRAHQTPRSAGLWRRRQGHPTPRSPGNRRPPNSARGSGQHHAACGGLPSERAPSLPKARKARAKRQTRSIGNVTAASLARTCVAVATSSSEKRRSSGICHGVLRALDLWAASGALVATFVLGWLPTAARRGTKSGVGAIGALVVSPATPSYSMANGARCMINYMHMQRSQGTEPPRLRRGDFCSVCHSGC